MAHAATIPFMGFDREAYDVVYERRETDDAVQVSSLSTFQIPLSVTAIVEPPETVTFEFSYPNDEPIEATYRPVEGHDGISVLVSRKTRKIIRVRFAKAVQRADDRNFGFDDRYAVAWWKDLGPYEEKVSRLNAQLISQILKQMPTHLIREIRKSLASTE